MWGRFPVAMKNFDHTNQRTTGVGVCAGGRGKMAQKEENDTAIDRNLCVD